MQPPLKIAMFSAYNFGFSGGVQECLINLSRQLTSQNHQIDVYGNDSCIFDFPHYYRIGPSINLPGLYGNTSSFLLTSPKHHDLIDQINNKYDILHLHDPYIPFLSWQFMNLVKIPIVVSFHNAWEKTSTLKYLAHTLPLFSHWFSQRVKLAIFPSQHTLHCWAKLFRSNVCTKIIKYGIDHQTFSR